MQALIAIPDFETLRRYGGAEQSLMRGVSGIPLLVRIIKTAIRAGVDSLVVIWPSSVPLKIWLDCQAALLREGINGITIVQQERFAPWLTSSWAGILSLLADRFVWLPWNWVTHKRALLSLPCAAVLPAIWSTPILIERRAVIHARFRASNKSRTEGIPVTSKRTAGEAARLLVAKSGKPLDGIYSTFNRWLCRPVVRLLSRTPITPNVVTLTGLFIAVVSAWMFSRGFYAAYVLGAVLFFLSGLCDEIDGMLARIKFRESAFGTWFEGFVDNATYLLIFGGITVGLFRQRGTRELIFGVALILGCVLSVLVINLQRKRSTDPARPNEYLGKMYKLWDSDSSNLISRVVRHIHVFMKKAVAVHYLLLFTLLGGLPVFLRLAALGSNLTWILGIYFSRRFLNSPAVRAAAPHLRAST
jgi:phosphatidylglycerophosphate synthase